MERQEIEAELNEVERDLADIARRAHIAASNLFATKDEWGQTPEAGEFARIANDCRGIHNEAFALLSRLQTTREAAKERLATVAAGEGGAE